MLLILFILNTALAYDPPKLYAGKTGVKIFNTKSGECIQDSNKACTVIPPETEISDLFMLNQDGEKYEKNKNQKPYVFNGKKRLGYNYNGTTVAIDAGDLTKRAPIRMGVRTPEVETSSADCCNSDAFKTKNALNETKDNLENSNEVRTKLKEFHNRVCDSLRPKLPETMDKEIENLKKEWDEFIKMQPSEADKKAALRAREIDEVSRTVLYETHPLGTLDTKEPQACGNDEDCPASACERKVITLSIYNRGTHPGCKSGTHYFGCKYMKDFAGAATKPSQYSIWNPTLTSTYMATCFLKDGLDKSPKLDKDYKLRVMQYKKVVDTITDTLYAENPYRGIEYKESGKGAQKGIKEFRHYYHPQGMIGCFQETFNNQYTTQVAYVEKNGNFGPLVLETIVPDDTSKEKTTFRFHKWNKPKNMNSENVTYSLARYENEDGWLISKDQIEKLNLRYNCTNMGLSVLTVNPQACKEVEKKHSFTSPLWAIEPPAKRASFTCTIGKKQVTLGGECDVKFQPISGVP